MRLMRLMMKSHFLKRCSLSERLKMERGQFDPFGDNDNDDNDNDDDD